MNDQHQQTTQPPTAGYRWTTPATKDSLEARTLRVFNSFSRKKEPLVTVDRRTIRWYCCGPTVYDVAHLGHARCYITFDIIRRILSAYFGYQVFYVMNITDIDDKIIKRARSNHLCDIFIQSALVELQRDDTAAKQKVVGHISEALNNYQSRRASEQDPAKRIMIDNILALSREALKQLQATIVNKTTSQQKDELNTVIDRLREVIADEQDSKLGHTVVDHEIFKSLTLSFEQEFCDDMRRLDVLPPSALSRVSEYIEETGAYIKQLESNGYAYRSGGSIYFDTQKFDSSPKHFYAKLVREAYGHKKELDEGEGELSADQGDKKRSPSDFALWKKSKPGEPQWITQDFEPGRPGWHIECSVMASKLLGANFDIHSGGYDLKFPHHDNEIAQAEAYYDTGHNWVNYFIHSGHLTISGCKMSKSLKNFITVRQALEEYSARQLRFAFLVHGWAETLDYSPNTMSTALSYEKTFREFFLNLTDVFRRRADELQNHTKWTRDDLQLHGEFLGAVNKLDAALCDNFDTRAALNVLSTLVREYNKCPSVNLSLAKDIACYVRQILSVFGANFSEINLDKYFVHQAASDYGQQQSTTAASGGDSDTAMKYVEALAQFRADIRKLSKGGDAQLSVKQILSLCDQLRDETLPNLGIRLEDKEIEGNPYVVKFVDAQTLAKERALAEKKEQEKKLKQETQRLEKLKLQHEREEKAKIPPGELFKSQTDKYSQFDDKGLPTHDSTGKEISKSALKKIQRMYSEQETRYHKYLADKKQAT